MDDTLFAQIQRLFERTYAAVGVNLEDCLIDRRRCAQLSALAGAQARELSHVARTFLRQCDGRLHIGIYYSSWLIEQLERHDPRRALSDDNIACLIAFVEEINHALHAALAFQRGERALRDESFARNLELQAGVDIYLVLLLFVAFYRRPQPMTAADRRWLRFHLFARRDPRAYESRALRGRYLETTRLSARYTRYLDGLNNARRHEEIRLFHALDYPSKKARILALPAPKRERDK